jgi:hypothetical protein
MPEEEGTAILDTMIKLGEEKLVNWQPNDLLISSSRTPWIGVDNPRNFQLGGLFIYRRVLEELREDLTRATSNDYLNPLAVNAFSKWSYDSDSWWLPRTEDVYKDGLDSLKQLRTDVKSGKATIFITSLKISRLLEKTSSGLASMARRLEDVEGVRYVAQKDASGKTVQKTLISTRDVPFNEWDDAYYEGQGALRETLQILRAIQIDAKVVFDNKQVADMFRTAIQNIEENKSYLYDPILVIKGGFMGIPSNCAPLTAAIQRTIRDLDRLIPQLNN